MTDCHSCDQTQGFTAPNRALGHVRFLPWGGASPAVVTRQNRSMGEVVWDVPRMRRLLDQWDVFVRTDRNITSDAWSVEIRGSGSVLRPRCAPEQVEATERRLGVTLPPSYRSFLMVTNGAYANSLGANVAGNDPHGYLSIEDADWMPKADPEWAELWCTGDWPISQGEGPRRGARATSDRFSALARACW
jgi:hypothetical protein